MMTRWKFQTGDRGRAKGIRMPAYVLGGTMLAVILFAVLALEAQGLFRLARISVSIAVSAMCTPSALMM